MFEVGGRGGAPGTGRWPPHTQRHVIEFLSEPVGEIFTDPDDVAWLAKLECRIMLDVVLIIQHVFDDNLERWARIYTRIDRGVGGLPLAQLTVDTILAIRQAGAQACEEEAVARSTP